MRLLLEKGADVDDKSKFGETALHLAAASGHEAVVRLLLEKGADVDERSRLGGRRCTGGRERARGGGAAAAREGRRRRRRRVNQGGRRCTGRPRVGTRRWCGCYSRRAPTSTRGVDTVEDGAASGGRGWTRGGGAAAT